MKTFSTAITRPRMSSGVASGTIVARMKTLTASAPASTRRATKARAYEWVTPSTTVATPNTATATSSVRPTWRRTGRTARTAVTMTGPDPGRRPQPAVADAADAEAVLGDRRQQRDGAAEEDGEHVEGDRAQQHLAADG